MKIQHGGQADGNGNENGEKDNGDNALDNRLPTSPARLFTFLTQHGVSLCLIEVEKGGARLPHLFRYQESAIGLEMSLVQHSGQDVRRRCPVWSLSVFSSLRRRLNQHSPPWLDGSRIASTGMEHKPAEASIRFRESGRLGQCSQLAGEEALHRGDDVGKQAADGARPNR